MRTLMLVTAVLVAIGAQRAAADDGSLGKVLDLFSSSWIDDAPKPNAALPKVPTTPSPEPAATPAAQQQRAARPPTADKPAQALGYKLPMCFLVDERVPENVVNTQMANLFKAYATCDIAVVGVTKTLKGNYTNVFGDQAEALSAAAREACNLNSQFGTRGAIQIFTADARLPKAMCRDPDAKGCSTLCEPLSVSMIGPGSDELVGLHESMHSNCCGRVCVNRGEGVERAGPGIDLAALIESPKRRHAEEGGTIVAEAISPAACASIRAGATKSAGDAYFKPPRNRRYYKHAESESRKLDLAQRRSLFEPRDPPKRVVLQDPSALSPEFDEDGDFSGTFGGTVLVGTKPKTVDAGSNSGMVASGAPAMFDGAPKRNEAANPGDVTATNESEGGHGRMPGGGKGKAGGGERLGIDEAFTADRSLASVGGAFSSMMSATVGELGGKAGKKKTRKSGSALARGRSLKRQGPVVSARDLSNYTVPDEEDPELSPYE